MLNLKRTASLLKHTFRISNIRRVWYKSLISLLIVSLLSAQFSFLATPVYAASSPWTQTDWVGGSGQTGWSDTTKFDSSSNVTTSTPGQVTLTNTEELSNTGFESDLSSWSEVPNYTLNDQFTTDRAAGAVNGTSAEPTGGTRTVTDTNNKISIASSILNFATGGVADNGIWYPSSARAAGKVLTQKVIASDTNGIINVGFDTNTSGAINDRLIFDAAGVLKIAPNGGTAITVGAYTADTYYIAGVMRATGFYWLIKGGAFTNWTLLYITALGTADGIPSLTAGSTTSIFTADNIRIPITTWLPTSLVYDTFTRGDGSIGSSETTGPDSQTTPQLSWTGGAISGNKNVISPTLGSEIVANTGFEGTYTSGIAPSWSIYSGTNFSESADFHGGAKAQQIGPSAILKQNVSLTGGVWYQFSSWYKWLSGAAATGGMRIIRSVGPFDSFAISSGTMDSTSYAQKITSGRAPASATWHTRLDVGASSASYLFDDSSLTPLTLSSLFSTVSTSDSDVIADANVTLTAGTQAGLVTNLDSTSSPANFLIAYHNGAGVILEKNVGGTYTQLFSAAATYSAGATLRVITYHSDATSLNVRVYYNNALVGTEQTITDAGIRENTKHGLFSTYSGNSFDDFSLWARGTGAEYTSAPFEELTATRDTTTTYSSSAGSAKLIAGGTDANYLQSVNVGNTNTYNFSAYAYTTGAAVTSSDLELYYNGSTISTTYTSVGGGWYQLTGTLTGANESRDYGVRVKAGKTVYVDNFSLNSYASSGTLTSSIFDSGQGSNWGDLTYSATTPASTSVTVKARSSNDSGMSGATAFSSCTAITSASDISSNNCITDTDRYIQYQLALATTDTLATPTFSDISIAFTVSDATAPDISLTPLSDPNTDTTPSLSGTATDAVGTVSAVQFQMDSTSGSWTACTADDAAFDEASETFTCTPSALSDGSHTMYVRATDSNGNTTGSGSESSDAFTIDATSPASVELDSPGNNSYTNNERPTFKWKATTDATAGLSKYVLEIDNPSLDSGQPSGDFNIDNIPTSGTTDAINNRYVIHFDGFSDSDASNNYISVYTRSSSDWSSDSNSGQNDGKLREGIVHWKVKAIDTVGNEASSSRTLFVDRTNPRVELTQINETPFSTNEYSTTDKTPTLYGKITDPLAGGDTTLTQDENGPRVTSGPKQVDIKVEEKEGLLYKLHTTYTINMDKSWYTCDNTEVTDNTKQKCDKYLPFEYTPEQSLDLGTYRITVTGKDKADNTTEIRLTLNITTLSEIVTQEEEQVIQETIKDLPQEEQEQVREELELTRSVEPSASANFFDSLIGFVRNLFNSIGNGIQMAFNWVGNGIQLAFNTVGRSIAWVFNSIGNGYNALAQNSPGIIKNAMLAIGNTFSGMMQGVNNAIAATKNGIANLAFAIGVKLEDVSYIAGTAVIKFGYLFVPEPTKIYDVQVAVLSPTSAKISWKTNHPANGKVNYGLDETYPFDIQAEKRTNDHEFTLTNLDPDTEYHFEVMSQNRNYVYDANRKFTTPPLENEN